MTSFHLLSFEGPDRYARAGGIASRISGLAQALGRRCFDVHLWFVGDPSLPAYELHDGVHLHRWCQWISEFHPRGVYDGEEGKCRDYAASLPPQLCAAIVARLQACPGNRVVVLAEEWHTADAVLHLDWLLRQAGLRERVQLLWNANNVFGFERIDWARLGAAATITTVSRYMRQRMLPYAGETIAIPNGLATEAYLPADRRATDELRRRVGGRPLFVKIARWDPDKNWLLAVDNIAEMKAQGLRPLLIARGGLESHGSDVRERAAGHGLRFVERQLPTMAGDPNGCLEDLDAVDILSLGTALTPGACKVLYRAADAVLANSMHEPFGLVGLEAMAAGGLACVGGTGEDYAVPGWNALALQTNDPRELVRQLQHLHYAPHVGHTLRRRARSTAHRFAWDEILQQHLFPRLDLAAPPSAALRPWSRHTVVDQRAAPTDSDTAMPMAADAA